MATLAPAAEQTAAAGTDIEVTQLIPAGVTATAGESPVSTGDTVAIEPTSSPTSDENTSTGWWVGGIVVIIALGAGGWYLIQKNRK
jgi:lysozyme family protein